MNALPLPVALADVLARGDVWRGDTLASLPEAAISSGHTELDAELPGGGWPCGCLTELLVDRSSIGEMSLLLPALGRLSGEGGWLALVAPPWVPHAPAWIAAGVALERLVIVRAGQDVAWSIEQLLACGGFSGVLAWPGEGVSAKALRRLQVAAEGRPTLACLWRPAQVADAPSPAPLRLALTADDSRLSVRVLKRRGRPPSRTVHLPFFASIPRPGRENRVVAGPALSLVADRGLAATPVA